MINNKREFNVLPHLKTEACFFTQKSILKRNNLPISLYESLNSKKIKKFRKIFSSLSKMKCANSNNNLISSFNNTKNSISSNNINNKEDNKIMRNSLINTEAELKMKKFMEKFNIENGSKKNVEYDLIKGRMFGKLKKYFVSKEESYNTTFDNNDDYSIFQKQKEFLQQKKKEYLSQNKINVITDRYPKLFMNERSTRRFEDIHMTPEEFLNKNFSKEEIEIMKRNINYFKLNKKPLKDWDLNINLTLKDSLDKEEEKLNQEIKDKNSNIKFKHNLRLKMNNKNISILKSQKEKVNKTVNFISQKNFDLKSERKENNPKFSFLNINHIKNIPSENNVKKIRKNFLFINPKNKLLYKRPDKCSRYEKHSKINNNNSEKVKKSKNFDRKSLNKKANNIRYIEDYVEPNIKKNEFKETQNLLNEIKSNYMKTYHQKVTQDYLIKNKNKLNNNLRDKITKLKGNAHYINMSDNDRLLFFERLRK